MIIQIMNFIVIYEAHNAIRIKISDDGYSKYIESNQYKQTSYYSYYIKFPGI